MQGAAVCTQRASCSPCRARTQLQLLFGAYRLGRLCCYRWALPSAGRGRPGVHAPRQRPVRGTCAIHAHATGEQQARLSQLMCKVPTLHHPHAVVEGSLLPFLAAVLPISRGCP